MVSTEAELRELSDRAVAHVMETQGTDTGRRTGWLMISTILIEAWDLYAISFILVFLKSEYHPGSLLLGFTSASVQAGAIIGALIGGWLADHLGRRTIFISTMIAFIVLAIAQSFATNLWWLAGIRLLLGIPLGSDISTGYAYIMESMPKSKREIMGSRWQGMFGIGEVASIIVITALYLSKLDHDLIWRIGLAIGAVPAAILLFARLNVPDTAMSLIQRGKFAQAKRVSTEMFGDPLDMLPDQDFVIKRPRTRDFLADIWADRIRRRASIFGWISNAMQGAEFASFAFYLPIIFVVVGVSGITGTNFMSAGIYSIAAVAGFLAPVVLNKIGHRGLARWGFGLAFVSLCVTALFLQLHWTVLVPITATALMWGHYWDASNGMTVASVVAPPRYRGTASGFGYLWVKAPLFVTIFLFPSMFNSWGVPAATLFSAVFSLVGWLAATFVLPEVYGYVEQQTAVRT